MKNLNSQILKLWKSYSLNKRIPYLYPFTRKENVDVVFIGLNPSFSEAAAIEAHMPKSLHIHLYNLQTINAPSRRFSYFRVSDKVELL